MGQDTFTTTGWREISPTERMRVTYGMHYLEGNRLPYFSITCDTQDRRSETSKVWRDSGGGAAHEDIAQHFPELRPLIPWHLFDQAGTNMHYRANAIFWYGMRVGWNERKSYDPDPWKCFLGVIAWGHVPGDEGEPRLTMTQRELGEWLDERLPKVQQAFMHAMKEANVKFIPGF